MNTATRVYFRVFDFGDDPEVVSALMRMPPTQAWVKGEPSDARLPLARRTDSRWALSSGLDDEASVEAHLAALLTTLELRLEEVRVVAQRFHVQIAIVQYFREMNPQFHMQSEILRRLADLGVPLYFDQYCLGEDEGS